MPNIMASNLNTVSRKAARQMRHKQKQNQSRDSRLELLPVELQLMILENVPTYRDLLSLTSASPRCRAAYHSYKKTVLARIAQTTLGEAFTEACMLQHWESNLNAYTEDEVDDIIGNDEATDCEDNNNYTPRGVWSFPAGPPARRMIPAEPKPAALNRHIQLKFLHDCEQHAMASTTAQLRAMKSLLTAQDFEEIMSFYQLAVQPLSSRLFGRGLVPEQELIHQAGLRDYSSIRRTKITTTERQRIERTFYRFQMCCRLYGPQVSPDGGETIDMGMHHRLLMVFDFFGRFDRLENEELYTVYTGLVSELHRYFNLVEYNEAWTDKLRDRAIASAQDARWNNVAYRLFTHKPIGEIGVTAGTLALGLGFMAQIDRVMAAAGDKPADEEVAAVLVARDPPELQNWFWEALFELNDTYHFSWSWPVSWTDEFWDEE